MGRMTDYMKIKQSKGIKKQITKGRVLLSEREKDKKKIEEQQEKINYLENNRKQVKEQIQSAEIELSFAKDMLTDIQGGRR